MRSGEVPSWRLGTRNALIYLAIPLPVINAYGENCRKRGKELEYRLKEDSKQAV
jgi:hypothetical protein